MRGGTGMWSSVLLILVVLVAAGLLWASEARLPKILAWTLSARRGHRVQSVWYHNSLLQGQLGLEG